MSDQEIRKANCSMSQLYTNLKNQLEYKYVKSAFDKVNNINHQIPPSSYLEQINSELIGETILHLAAKKSMFKYVHLILRHGANFTIKNNNGLTAVHQSIRQAEPLSIISNNELINSVLDAHVQLDIRTNPFDKDGISHFHAACMTNNAKAVEYFLSNGASVNQSISMESPIMPGYTPLHIAVNFCVLETVEILLKNGADVQIKNAKDMTPLDVLLEQKLKISNSLNVENEANLCLQQHQRKYCYHKQIMKTDNEKRNSTRSAAEDLVIIDKIIVLFLEQYCQNRGYDIVDDNFFMHINIACTIVDTSLLESMLKEVENVNYCIHEKSTVHQGYTALHFAALFSVNTVKFLLKRSADIEATATNGTTPFDICIERYSIEEIHSIMSMITAWKSIVLSDSKTHLMDLIYAMRNVDHFRSFLKNNSKGKNLHVPNDSPLWPGYTPLHLAVIFSKRVKSLHCSCELKDMYLQLVKDCLDDKVLAVTIQDANGCTPVHLAFRLNVDLIDLLLQNHRTIVNPIDNDGLSHLHIAALSGNEKLTVKLLSSGADVNATVRRTIKYEINRKTSAPSVGFVTAGSTSLHIAIKAGKLEIARILLKHGADPYAQDVYNATPIHYEIASPISHLKCNSILPSLPNLRDSVSVGGLTHLHVASHAKEANAIEQLLNLGADVNARVSYQSNNPNDPMHLLTKYNDFAALNFALPNPSLRVTTLLLKRGADVLPTALYEALDARRGNSTIFVEALKHDIATQVRLEKHSGLSMLHVACNSIDFAWVKRLLNEGTDVDKRAHFDAPIWPGCTPLHCLMRASGKGMFGGSFASGFRGILRLMLDNRADVTLANAELDTTVHLAFRLFRESRGKIDISAVMAAHRDGTRNPVDRAGISHFHIACGLHDTAMVRRFLKCNHDANEPVDYFCDEFAGYTTLHFAVSDVVKRNSEISSQLETIELLIECGVDVNAEDAWGNTPLHVAAKNEFSSVALFESIINGGANLKVTNILGETPLEILLKSKNPNVKAIELLLTHGCHANSFNTFTEEGYIAMTVSKRHHKILEISVFEDLMKMTNPTAMNEERRTVVHNVVSTGSPFISDIDYVDLFESLQKSGCDVDSQDNLGKTALHIAVRFRNYEAVAGLLKTGADPNILDINGKLAFSYVFESSELANDSENYNYTGIITRLFAVHIQRLQLSGLDVHPLNVTLKTDAFEKCALEVNVDSLKDYFYSELEKTKTVKFGSKNLTLYDLLSETGAVASYPTMTFVERRALNEFFESSHKCKLYSEYIDMACLLKWQYRKAIVRLSLIGSAIESLRIVTRIDLPKLCCEAVLRYFKNADLVNLIAATR